MLVIGSGIDGGRSCFHAFIASEGRTHSESSHGGRQGITASDLMRRRPDGRRDGAQSAAVLAGTFAAAVFASAFAVAVAVAVAVALAIAVAVAFDLPGSLPQRRMDRGKTPKGRRTWMCAVRGRGRMPLPRIPGASADPERAARRAQGRARFLLVTFLCASKEK
jgi:hypothetical protein